MSGAPAAPRRRGRPRAIARTTDLEPREDILQRAAKCFSAAGVTATSMADIAAAVGVSPPAIYYYFDNVDAIVQALLEYVVEESAAFATAAASGPGPCGPRLHALVAQHVDRLTAGRYDLWFVAGLSDAEARRFTTVHRRATQWRQAVARLVTEGIERGELREVDGRLAVAAVSGLVYGALELRHLGREVDPIAVADLAVASLTQFAPSTPAPAA